MAEKIRVLTSQTGRPEPGAQVKVKGKPTPKICPLVLHTCACTHRDTLMPMHTHIHACA